MIHEVATSANELWEASSRRLPEFSPEEQRAGLVLHRELARGEPIGAAQLAQALAVPNGDAEDLLTESGLSPFVYTDEGGRVLGFWGLSTVRMPHRFNLEGRRLWTWCAQDSLFLPELLGETANVESADPESGELVELTISPDGIEFVAPQGVVVSFNSPEAWELTSAERVITTACHHIFFFTSRSSGERWVAKHRNTVLLSLEDAFAIGKLQNAHLFGEELVRRENNIKT